MRDILWFVKAARARTTDDSETWREGGVTPTLNIFDNNGDTRATVLIAYSIREDAGGGTFSATERTTSNALQAHQPSVQSHHAQLFIVQEIPVEEPVLMRQREGKPGGGKGPLMSEDKSLTLAVNNDQVLFQPVIAFSAGNSEKAYGIGLSEDVSPPLRSAASGTNQTPTILAPVTVMGDITHALTHEGADASEDGTGRGTPSVATPIGFQPSDGGFANTTDDEQSATLKASDPAAVVYPLDMRNATRDPEKFDEVNRQGVGVGDEGDPAHTVTTAAVHAVATDIIVRRLTPLETERLQGFPDSWTSHRVDFKTGQVVEQKDSSRYKQMGNAVAVPVVTWIMQNLANILDNPSL